jgi:glycine cleavage system H lipoate-binding protein
MRYYSTIYPHIWFYNKNNITRIGITNKLKDSLNINEFFNKNNSTENINQNLKVEVLPLNSTLGMLCNIGNVINNKNKYSFHTHRPSKIVSRNELLIVCPKLILTNNEVDNWLVDVEQTNDTNNAYSQNYKTRNFDHEYYLGYA